MATAIVLFIVVPVILMVALVFLIRSHVYKSRPDFENLARNMPTGDAMYAMMFPDIAQVCKPEGLLDWLAWYEERRANRQIIRDGRRWHGQVPGFPGAATMAVTAQGKEDNAPELLVLQDAGGNTLFEALIEYKADGRTLLTNNAGVFTLNPNDERKVRFAGATRGFVWRGPGLWNLKGDGAMPPVSAQGQQMDVARPGAAGAAGALATGVAVGAVGGIAASRILEERERARQERKAQRQASLDTDY